MEKVKRQRKLFMMIIRTKAGLLTTILVLFILGSYAQNDAQSVVDQLIVENNVVGISAGYSVDGDIKWQNAQGYADEEEKRVFEIGTKVRLASIAKPMTAIAVMQLVEKGLIDIDIPIQNYIPDYPEKSNTQITTRHLLSHTSGIAGYKDGREAETTIQYSNLAEAVNFFKNRELLFEPGTRYSYTTYGYTVLGLIIEKVSGMSFGDYVKEHIWDKVGMQNTGVEKFGEVLENESCLYHRNKKGKIKKAKENNLSNRIPGGGFYSTLEDMIKFGNAVIDGSLIKESTLDLMREHHSLEKEANAYGFGWFLYNPKPNEGAIIGHSGEQTGSCTQLYIIPSTKTVVVVLANTSGTYQYIAPAAGKLLALSQAK